MRLLVMSWQTTKRIGWALLVIGLAALLAGPAWADAPRTAFTGTETITGGLPPTIIPAGTRFHVMLTQFATETASDPRVSGTSTIVAHAIWDLPAMTGPMWGTFQVVNAAGQWNGHWVGSRTATATGDIVSSVVGVCEGSGAYKGLIARWNITGVNAGPDNPYLHYDGFIVEATRARTDLPMKWRGTRTEALDLDTMEFQIVEETGEGTHLGRSANTGFGFLVPTSQTAALVTGVGHLTAANGDQVYWVVSGVADLSGQEGATVSVYFAGGTGRFDEAIGQVTGRVFASFGPPDADNVVSATFDYGLSGMIRY